MTDRERRERRSRGVFTAEFIDADCTREDITLRYEQPDIQLDLCSTQFALHYSFESLPQTRRMLANACGRLKPGGFFVGTLPDAQRIVAEIRKSPDGKFKNEVCSIEFTDPNAAAEEFRHPLFGAKYLFHLEDVVNCPEYLVHFPLLERILLDEFDMELVFKKNFAQMLDSYGETREGKQLLARMQALEPYPPDADVELMGGDGQYDEAKRRTAQIAATGASNDPNRPLKVGALSKSEWEVATIYLAFAFRKKTSS